MKEQRRPSKSSLLSNLSRDYSSSSLHIPSKDKEESLLHSSMPPDLLLSDLMPLSTMPASSASSLHSRNSREIDYSASTSPTSIASSSHSQTNTPTQISVTGRVLSPISASGGSRLPRRNLVSPLPHSPHTPRIPTRVISNLPKSKGVQMVSEMRARVKTLEMKIHSNMPRLRVGSSATSGVGNPRVPLNVANRLTQVADKEVPNVNDSPDWVIITDRQGSPRKSQALTSSRLPPPDFSNNTIRPNRAGSALGRTIKPTLYQSQTQHNPRSRTPLPPADAYKPPLDKPVATAISPKEPAELARPHSRIAAFAASTASALAPPTDNMPRRSVTPTQLPQSSHFRKSTAGKPPTTSLMSNRRGSASANVVHAGTTPGRGQRRNVTTPSTPPPPLPSLRPVNRTTAIAEVTAEPSAFMKSRIGAPAALTKSRIGRPKSVGGPPRDEDGKGRERSGTMH